MSEARELRFRLIRSLKAAVGELERLNRAENRPPMNVAPMLNGRELLDEIKATVAILLPEESEDEIAQFGADHAAIFGEEEDGAESDSSDEVDHPKHYNAHPSGVEWIDIVEEFPFNVGSAIKYLWRAGLKGATDVDLAKAEWYVARERARLRRKENV